jgi:hypothetical protein
MHCQKPQQRCAIRLPISRLIATIICLPPPVPRCIPREERGALADLATIIGRANYGYRRPLRARSSLYRLVATNLPIDRVGTSGKVQPGRSFPAGW